MALGHPTHFIGRNAGQYELFAGSSVTSTPGPPTSLRIVAVVFNGASSKIYVSGGFERNLSGTVGTHTLTGLTIGNRFTNAQSLGGDIVAVLVANRAFSATEIDTVGRLLRDKYGPTWANSYDA